MPKFAPALRIGLVIIGGLLVIGAFLGVLYLGAGTNPPPLHIAVAVRDVSPGEQLKSSDYRIVEQILDPNLARLYVQERELRQFIGAFVVEMLRKGDPVNKVKLSAGDNAAALNRYSLSLDNPNSVVMNLPVNPDIIPSKISPGDFVNILFVGGAENGINQLPQAKSSPESPDELPAAINVEAISETEPSEVGDTLMTLTATVMLTSQTPTPTPEIVLPLADLMLERVEILDVNYQQVQNSAYGSDGPNGDQPYLNGPISAIIVKVPRSHQTLLMFGASMSKLRFALASPKLDAHILQPQMGMDWGKYVELYRWKESQVAARGETVTQTLYPDAGQVTPSAFTTPTQQSVSVTTSPPTPTLSSQTPTSASPTPPQMQLQPVAP